MNYVMLFSILTGIFAICTAIAQSSKDSKSDKERINDKTEIINLQKGNNQSLQQTNILQKQIITSNLKLSEAQEFLILSSQRLTEAQNEIIKSNSKLIEANNRIEELNIRQLNYQSGENSFGYIILQSIVDIDGSESYMFGFIKEGEFPMYDVTITSWNLEDFQNPRPDARASISDFQKYNTSKLGDIALGGSRTFGNLFKIPDNQITKFNFSITAKNGQFSQVLRIYKKGKTMASGYRVNTVTDGKTKFKVLKEFVDKNFPLNSDGTMNWN